MPSTLAAAAVVLPMAAALAAAPPAGDSAGRYVVRATVHVDAAALPDRDGDVELDVVVAPGAAPDALRLRATYGRYACDLQARLGDGGALDLAAGQPCSADVSEPDARGHVDATLKSGRGRVQGGALELDLAFDLAGRVSTRVGGKSVKVLGQEVSVPEAWTPEVPLRGGATASGKGRRLGAGDGGR
jgi:hypothetical protein